MKLRSWNFAVQAILGLVFMTPFVVLAQSDQDVAYKVNGKDYTFGEIKKENQSSFYDVDKKRYELVEQLARQTYLDNFWQKQAKESKTSVEEAQKKYFDKNIKVKDQEVTETMERFKDHPQLSKLDKKEQKKQIVEYLQERERQALVEGIFDAGMKKGELVISFPMPDEPLYSIKVVSEDHARYNAGPDFLTPKGCKGDECPITIVEYSEFQCPFCSRVMPDVKKVLKDYEGKVRWVVRDFPLSFHPRARPAAIVAHCAGQQKKFWEMYNELFDNQSALGDEDFVKYAKNINLDVKKWQDCVKKPGVVEAQIDKNFESGSKYGVSGTPAFFINGRKLSGALPYQEFKRVIDAELNRKKS